MKWRERFVHGDVELCISGRNAERFFQLCVKNGICIERLVRMGPDKYRCHMTRRGVWDSRPYYRKTGMHCKIIHKWGLPFLLFRYRKRILFPLALCAVLYLMGYCSQFIWKIEINGNSCITAEQMISYLEKNDASYGTRKSAIDCDEIERMIREDFDEIIWASVAMEGTNLVIELQEKTGTGVAETTGKDETIDTDETEAADTGEAETTATVSMTDYAEMDALEEANTFNIDNQDEGSLTVTADTAGDSDNENRVADSEAENDSSLIYPSDGTTASYVILADQDATITSIITRRGLAAVAAGDEVFAGDVLVEGMQEVLDDNGETKFWYAAIPDADIIGTVILEYTDCISASTTVKSYGDAVLSVIYIQLPLGRFQIDLPFQMDETVEILESYYQIHLTEQFYLPFGMGFRQVIPVEEETAERTDEEALDLAETNLDKYLQTLEEDGVVILSKTVTMHKKGDEYIVEGEIKVQETIGTIVWRE